MKRGAKPLYHWTEWFSLKRFMLRRGTHYICSTSAMASQIRNHASSLGIGISVDELEDGNGTMLLVTVKSGAPDMFGEKVTA